jgi:hypothetical protein
MKQEHPVPKGRLKHAYKNGDLHRRITFDGFGRPFGTRGIANGNPAVNCRAILNSPSGRKRTPTKTGQSPGYDRKLERDTLALLHIARARFPNLRFAYLGSRTYGGYAVGALNREPYAYESAFAARWLIQRQMKGDPELAEPKAPLLLWGPYLWADGEKGRKLDSLVWRRDDFGGDGVHPSNSGREKVATLLRDFFTSDPLAKGWFAKK